MAKKRKKIKASPDKLYKSFDWSVDPQTSKEIISLACFALGIIFTLAIFGAAGTFGQATFRALNSLFDISAFIVPVILIITGAVFWTRREANIKGPTLLGLILILIFIPALFGTLGLGGAIGNNVANYIHSVFGGFVGFLIILGLDIIAGLLATNSSIKRIKEIFMGEKEPEDTPSTEPDAARVSVFQTVKNKLTNRPPKPQDNQVPVTPMKPMVRATLDKDWEFPSIELLPDIKTKADPGDIEKKAKIIQKTLSDFGIEVSMGLANIGPTVTQYVLKPANGVKVTAITSRSNDLALALASPSIRIEAPIPGQSAVGIEIPNERSATVTLRDILSTKEYSADKSNLKIALGLDVAGKPFIADIGSMPHLLVAGSTGAGKSVAINAMILSLLYANSPSDLRMILIDPKRVEFTRYNGIPNLLTTVVTEVDKIVNTLRWTVAEMDRRYNVFAQGHYRNIAEYNQGQTDRTNRMHYIVVIIDELADLMIQAAGEVESSIVRISQLARATGIHLVVATQRPSVNVITGIIKANIATRIAFAVASQIDSRTILDQAGAEQLLGRGDMLFLNGELGKPKRVQGVLVGEKEITAVTDFLKKNPAAYDDSIQEFRPTKGGGHNGQSSEEDDAYDDAKEIVVSNGSASASLLQRRLRIGYNRAARLLDMLEDDNIIGPAEGAKPRKVLITVDQLDAPRPSVQTYYQNEVPTVEITPNKTNPGIRPFPKPGEIEIQDDEDDI